MQTEIKNQSPKLLIAAAIGTIGLLGCGSQNFGIEPSTDNFAQTAKYNTEVDVLFVVDKSGSMSSKQAKLADSVPAFVDGLDQTRLDYRIAVITMDMSGQNSQRGQFLSGDGAPAVLTSETANVRGVLANRIRQSAVLQSSVPRGLEAMKMALTPPMTEVKNGGFLRAQSLLAVIFISDDNDNDATTNYQAWLDQIKPPLPYGDKNWVVNTIGIRRVDSCQTSQWDPFNRESERYFTLSEISGGVSATVCDPEYQRTVSSMKARILEVATEYKLARRPHIPSLRVFVNGVAVSQSTENGWSYYEPANSIRFYGAAIPASGANVRVDYDPRDIM